MANQSDNNAWRRRLHPKLRVIFNGDETVNTIRAEVASSVKVSDSAPKTLVSGVPRLWDAATTFQRPVKSSETRIKDLKRV